MDLRKFPRSGNIDEQELLSLWWYQPYIFADDIVSGVAPSWFIKGFDSSIIKRSHHPHQFKRFWDLSGRAARMYEDWLQALCDLSHVDLKQASVFELACNSGYLLFSLKERGARHCVVIDQADLGRQQSILGEITGIEDIDFREGKWSSETHSLSGLHEDERFDLVMCTAFAQHISDPLHLFRELSNVTGKALLLHTAVGSFKPGMHVSYVPAEHHEKWGDSFPNNFDTAVSPKLLEHSLKQSLSQKSGLALGMGQVFLAVSPQRCLLEHPRALPSDEGLRDTPAEDSLILALLLSK